MENTVNAMSTETSETSETTTTSSAATATAAVSEPVAEATEAAKAAEAKDEDEGDEEMDNEEGEGDAETAPKTSVKALTENEYRALNDDDKVTYLLRNYDENADIERLSLRKEKLEAELAAISKELDETRANSTKKTQDMHARIRQLISVNLSLVNVEDVIKSEFAVKRQVPSGAARKSHKLSGDALKDKIMDLIRAAGSDGILSAALFTSLAGEDKQAILRFLKQQEAQKKVVTKGQTRSRKFFIA